MRTERHNGYDIHIKAVRVHQGGGAELARDRSRDGYVPLVEIERNDEVYVDWHRPKVCAPCDTREQAEADAIAYAARLVERRPFDGPPPGLPIAA
jgi:hypothetical protein